MRFLQEQIAEVLESQKKVVILYGARQIGKTTLMKNLAKKYPKSIFLNAELPRVKEVLETKNPEYISSFLGNNDYIFIDEAQKISEIGSILKILYDSFPKYSIMATGSSSFELSSRVHEALTGRNRTFLMYPLSLAEWQEEKKFSRFDMEHQLENFLQFGMYPEVLEARSFDEKKTALQHLSSDYLYQDVLQFESLRNPKLLRKLLQALALQLGNEVSYHELATLLKTSSNTIESYIDLLEKSFVIFTLPAFSNNPRKELSKKQKIYFYDIGIRNAVIDAFQPFSLRNDKGACWENFCIVEQKKAMQKKKISAQEFFWRSYTQKEVDYIWLQGEKIQAFEYKCSEKKSVKAPLLFRELYPNAEFSVVTPQNFWEVL